MILTIKYESNIFKCKLALKKNNEEEKKKSG